MKDKHKQMYMRIAEAVSLTSSAKRLQVGAVAVKNNMVIGTGYNGLPGGVDGDCEDETMVYQEVDQDEDGLPIFALRPKLTTKPEVRHAEANLLLNLAKSTESSEGAVLFCTHACCKFCAMDIVDAGIKNVYYRNEYRSTEGIEYLLKNGIKVEKI